MSFAVGVMVEVGQGLAVGDGGAGVDKSMVTLHARVTINRMKHTAEIFKLFIPASTLISIFPDPARNQEGCARFVIQVGLAEARSQFLLFNLFDVQQDQRGEDQYCYRGAD